MKASKFPDVQMAFMLHQGADGILIADICHKAGISHAYFNRAECLNTRWVLTLADAAEVVGVAQEFQRGSAAWGPRQQAPDPADESRRPRPLPRDDGAEPHRAARRG